jgi:hypothetical protein
MTQFVGLDGDFVLDQQIIRLGLIVEDDVGLLVTGSTDVRTEHDLVWRVTAELRLVDVA